MQEVLWPETEPKGASQAREPGGLSGSEARAKAQEGPHPGPARVGDPGDLYWSSSGARAQEGPKVWEGPLAETNRVQDPQLRRLEPRSQAQYHGPGLKGPERAQREETNKAKTPTR